MCNGGESSAPSISSLRLKTHVLKGRGPIQDEFSFGRRLIGRGGFGEVSMGVRRSTHAVRAVKSVPHKGACAHSRELGGDRHEAAIMASVDHPNVVKLVMTFEDKNHIHLVMELCSGGDLAGHLTEAQRFCGLAALSIMKQVLRSVAYLHKLDICHRDVKLENFLVQRPGPLPHNTLKIADFGLACGAGANEYFEKKMGTVRYWSPELVRGRYGRSCDVWSCGVIVYTLLCGKLPFNGKNDDEVITKVKRGNYAFLGSLWESVSDACRGFVRYLLKYDPADRPTAAKALEDLVVAELSEREAEVFDVRVSRSACLARALSGHRASLLAAGAFALSRSSATRRAALRALSWQVDDLDVPDFSELFLALDTDSDGRLGLEELRAAGITELKEVDECLTQICPIDYTDFLVIMNGETLCLRTSAFRAAFSALDRDGDGIISAADLQGIPGYSEGGPNVTYEDFEDEVLTLHL